MPLGNGRLGPTFQASLEVVLPGFASFLGIAMLLSGML